MFTLDRRSIFQLIIIVLLLIAGSYLLYSFGIMNLFLDLQRLKKFIHDHRTYAALIFIGLQALQVVAAPVPGEATGIAGGMLFDPFWGFVYSTIGLTIGSWLAFIIARLLGRHIVEIMVKPDVIKRYDYVMKHKGLFLAFVMFLIPGFPKDILCYILGLGHMSQGAFLLVSTLARMPGTMLLTFGGTYVAGQRYVALFSVAGIGMAAILLVMIYRERIEAWFRMIRARHHRKVRAERRRKMRDNEP